MKELNLFMAGACFTIGVVCLLQGSYVLGGVNLFLGVWNYKTAGMYE